MVGLSSEECTAAVVSMGSSPYDGLLCRQPASGAAPRPRPPAAGYKHLSPAQREKLEAALAGGADAEQAAAEAAESIRTEVRRAPHAG